MNKHFICIISTTIAFAQIHTSDLELKLTEQQVQKITAQDDPLFFAKHRQTYLLAASLQNDFQQRFIQLEDTVFEHPEEANGQPRSETPAHIKALRNLASSQI